jgi:hypothetical protein
LLPGQERPAKRGTKKGREKPSQFPPLRFRKETRQRERRAETPEARIGRRGTTVFFGEANAFLPGQGIISPEKVASVRRTPANKNSPERKPFPFSTRLGLSLNIKITKLEYQTPFLFFLVFGLPGSYNQPVFGDRRFHLQRIYPQWSNRSLPTPSKTS